MNKMSGMRRVARFWIEAEPWSCWPVSPSPVSVQNCNITEAGRHLWMSSCLNLSLKQEWEVKASPSKLCTSCFFAFFFFFPDVNLEFRGFHLLPHCFLFFHQAPPRRVLLPSLLPSRYSHTLIGSCWAFCSPGWVVPALSASPHTSDALTAHSSLWSFAGRTPPCPGWPSTS